MRQWKPARQNVAPPVSETDCYELAILQLQSLAPIVMLVSLGKMRASALWGRRSFFCAFRGLHDPAAATWLRSNQVSDSYRSAIRRRGRDAAYSNQRCEILRRPTGGQT